MEKQNREYTVGGINLRKLLKQLGKYDGSNYLDLIKELIDNSFDANTDIVEIIFNTETKTISINDKGKGMDRMAIEKFTSLYSENNDEGRTNGKFGIGSKKACAVLSGLGVVNVETVCNNVKSTINIDYKKAMVSEDSYIDSIPVTSVNTDEPNYTNIDIICSEEKILVYFKELYMSKHIDNLAFELGRVYYPELEKGREIILKFDDEQIEIKPINLISDDEDLYIYKKYKIYIYKKGNNKRPVYVYKDDTDQTYLFEKITNGFKRMVIPKKKYKFTEESFTIEFCLPKETRIVSNRKNGLEFNIKSNKDIIIDKLEDIKKDLKLDINFQDIMFNLRNVEVKRNDKILASLDFEARDITKGTDSDKKAEINNIFKRITYESTSDEYINLTQETKSKVDWNVCGFGIKDIIKEKLNEFIHNEISEFVNEKVCTDCHLNNEMFVEPIACYNNCKCPKPTPEEKKKLAKQIKLAEQKRMEAEEQKRMEAEEQKRMEAEEQKRVEVEEQGVVKEEQGVVKEEQGVVKEVNGVGEQQKLEQKDRIKIINELTDINSNESLTPLDGLEVELVLNEMLDDNLENINVPNEEIIETANIKPVSPEPIVDKPVKEDLRVEESVTEELVAIESEKHYDSFILEKVIETVKTLKEFTLEDFDIEEAKNTLADPNLVECILNLNILIHKYNRKK